MNDYRTCPINQDAEGAEQNIVALEKYFRRLGKLMRKCDRCAYRQDCPFLQQFKRDIDQALVEVWKAWEAGAPRNG